MSETEITPDDVQDSFAYHEKLNPALWDQNDEIHLDVRVALLRAAKEFAAFLDLPSLDVRDVILTGSNAAFNYTEWSDLDVHIVVAYDETVCPDLAENFFSTKKNLWNQTHDISVRDMDVEMYVEDADEGVTAAGIYSLLRGEWITKPESGEEPSWDDGAVAAKVEYLATMIDETLAGDPDDATIETLMGKIRKMRKAGLARGGEFSIENLAFKALRNLGFIERLWQSQIEAQDRRLSLEADGA